MKLIGIGDLFIPKEYIEKGFSVYREKGIEVETYDWGIPTYDKLQEINLLIEQKGSNAYEVDSELVEKIKEADILITQFCPVNQKVIEQCKNLKVIGVLRGGYENIDLEYATKKGITVFNTVGRNADSVADFTVGAMISECRNIAKGHLGLKQGIWIREYPNTDYIPDLPGKTVGIIGYGEIGRKVAKRLKGFDMNILVYDPYASGNLEGVEVVSLEQLMMQSDFVTLHARLTEENHHLINEKMLSLMKPTAYIINTSRAGLIDEEALYRILKDRKIAGAMLDVFEKEPPGVEYPLVTLENVTLTPHMAGGSKDAFWQSPVRLEKEMECLFDPQMKVSRCVLNTDTLKNVYPLFGKEILWN